MNEIRTNNKYLTSVSDMMNTVSKLFISSLTNKHSELY